jgi:hypothetical protein
MAKSTKRPVPKNRLALRKVTIRELTPQENVTVKGAAGKLSGKRTC